MFAVVNPSTPRAQRAAVRARISRACSRVWLDDEYAAIPETQARNSVATSTHH